MTLIQCSFFQQCSQKMQIEPVTNPEKYWICNRNKFMQKWHGKPKQWKVIQKCSKNTANGHRFLIQAITNAIQPLVWRPYIWTNCRELSSVKLYIYTKSYVLFKKHPAKNPIKFVSIVVLWFALANHVTKELIFMQINVLLIGRGAILTG